MTIDLRARHFDAWCRLADNTKEATLRRVLRDVHLFRLEPQEDSEAIERTRGMTYEEINDLLLLPFDFVAVEDDISCFLAGRAGHVSGWDDPWEVSQIRRDARDRGDVLWRETVLVEPRLQGETYVGQRRRFELAASPISEAQIEVFDQKSLQPLPPSLAARTQARTSQDLVHFFLQIALINSPLVFMVEGEPRKPPPKGKLPWSDRRSVYTVMTVPRIRRSLGLARTEPGQQGQAPAAHWRRAHFRTLRSERFGDRRGERVRVKAAWIGPKEAEVGGRRYRVLVDA